MCFHGFPQSQCHVKIGPPHFGTPSAPKFLNVRAPGSQNCFISALRRFIARCGRSQLLWSDHGSNFVGAKSDLKGLMKFLNTQMAQKDISDFCTTQHIEWKFIPEKVPHFGGLWESVVRSMKYHLKRVMSDVKLNFEECSTVLTQIEACTYEQSTACCLTV